MSVLLTLYSQHRKQYIFEVFCKKIIIVSQKIVKKKKSAEKRMTMPKVVVFERVNKMNKPRLSKERGEIFELLKSEIKRGPLLPNLREFLIPFYCGNIMNNFMPS